jgi:hypothetical protein
MGCIDVVIGLSVNRDSRNFKFKSFPLLYRKKEEIVP